MYVRAALCLVAVIAAASLSSAAFAASVQRPAIRGLACATIYPQAPIPGIPSMNVAVMRLTYGPGLRGPDHTHATDEYVSVVAGRGTLRVKGASPRALGPSSTVVVPAGVVHEIDNASSTVPLVYLSFKVGKPHAGDDDISRPKNNGFNHCPRD